MVDYTPCEECNCIYHAKGLCLYDDKVDSKIDMECYEDEEAKKSDDVLKILVIRNSTGLKLFSNDKEIQKSARVFKWESGYDISYILESQYKIDKNKKRFDKIISTIMTAHGNFNTEFLWDEDIRLFVINDYDNGRHYHENWSGLSYNWDSEFDD